jgi:CheY-like chemotaxis protein
MRIKHEKLSQDNATCSKSVLIIEDDDDSASSIAEMITFLGHRPVVECSRDAGLQRLEKTSFDYLIMDLRMPGMLVEEFVKKVRSHFPNIRTVLISGNANVQQIATTLRLDSSLHKPFKIEELAKFMNHTHAP